LVVVAIEFLEASVFSAVAGPLGMRMTAKADLLRRLIAPRAVCVGVLEGQDAIHGLAALADEVTAWGGVMMVAACRKYWIVISADSV